MIETLLKDREETLPRAALPHFSHSRVSRYLLCPEQYRLYYVEQLRPRYPPATLVFGQLVHQALAELFARRADPAKHFRDSWAALKDFQLNYKAQESWEKLRASGEALLGKFVTDELPKIGNVRSVEKPFELRVSGVDAPFVGIVDLVAEIETKQTIVDFKTSASAYDRHQATLADQLSAYNLAEPTVQKLALCVLVKTKEPKIEWHVTERNGLQLSEYLAKVVLVARDINAAHFYKRPGMWCTWCDYLPLCVGDSEKAKRRLISIV
jgi:CRISPR/Cas system-associated exonuclease Cas4 (RecB family)